MESYQNLIYSSLDGETPKQKFEALQNMQRLLQKIAFPRRGSEEESWTIQDVADYIQGNGLIEQHKKY